MTASVLAARGVVKRYGRQDVLRGADLALAERAVVLLAGANGAGKTTLLRVLATLEKPDAGAVRVAGVDALADGAAARRVIGYAGHDAGTYPALTVREHLAFHAGFFAGAAAAVPRVADRFGLTPLLDRRAAALSRGQRQRLTLARAFVHAPRLVLLDEPWTALDADGRAALDAAITDAARDGAAVLATTQDAERAARFDGARTLVLVDGRLTEAHP